MVMTPTAVMSETTPAEICPSEKPIAARIKLNSEIWLTVTPVINDVRLRYPRTPIITSTMSGLPMRIKSENAMTGSAIPCKLESTSDEPRIAKNIRMNSPVRRSLLKKVCTPKN